MKKHAGFSLIEILIVLVILSVLAVALLPTYNQYVLKSHRSEAIQALAAYQVLEEKYRVTHATYGSLEELGASNTSLPNGYYTLSIPSYTDTHYEIRAEATGSQAADTACSTMSITYNNGTTEKNIPSCWES